MLYIMNLKTITLALGLSIVPSTSYADSPDLNTEIVYAKPKPLEDELKELAELAIQCGEKVSFEDYGSQNGVSGRYHFDSYSLDVPVKPDGSKSLGLPFPEKVYFHFRDGSISNGPNQVVDHHDRFEIIGREAGYFSCHYQHQGDFQGCDAYRFIDDFLEARIRKTIEFIKKNVSCRNIV